MKWKKLERKSFIQNVWFWLWQISSLHVFAALVLLAPNPLTARPRQPSRTLIIWTKHSGGEVCQDLPLLVATRSTTCRVVLEVDQLSGSTYLQDVDQLNQFGVTCFIHQACHDLVNRLLCLHLYQTQHIRPSCIQHLIAYLYQEESQVSNPCLDLFYWSWAPLLDIGQGLGKILVPSKAEAKARTFFHVGPKQNSRSDKQVLVAVWKK